MSKIRQSKLIDSIDARRFKTYFVPQIASVLEILENRLLPNLSDEQLEAEAEARAKESWEEQCRTTNPEADPADMADQATDTGIRFFELMYGLKQGTINLFAVKLFHLFEQQLKDAFGVDDKRLKRLLDRGLVDQGLCSVVVDCTIKEMRLVANTVKHGKGPAYDQLYERCPDLFVHPLLQMVRDSDPEPPLFLEPLMGEGLYVRLEHLQKYRDSLEEFWMSLSSHATSPK